MRTIDINVLSPAWLVQDRKAEQVHGARNTIITIPKTYSGSLWVSATALYCSFADILVGSRVTWAIHMGMVRIVTGKVEKLENTFGAFQKEKV